MTLLKDFVDRSTAERLGGAIAAVDDEFALAEFVDDAAGPLAELELKARIGHIGASLGRHLPADFPVAAGIVARAIEQPGLDIWAVWPVNAWLEKAGAGHFERALGLMERVTSRSSSEFAVRPFIDARPQEMKLVLERWARSPDPHVRRLASEGSRPRLPWAQRLTVAEGDPAWAASVLDLLREDGSEDVRRSVANHLNDISKVDAQDALHIAARWRAEGGRHVDWILRHGLRTLVKRGDRRALELIGADTDVRLAVTGLTLASDRLSLGDVLDFTLNLGNQGHQPVHAVVDYAIHFVKANGSTARKVFKLKALGLQPSQQVRLARRLALRPISTRRYYSGRHLLEVQANGSVLAAAPFHLAVPAVSAGRD